MAGQKEHWRVVLMVGQKEHWRAVLMVGKMVELKVDWWVHQTAGWKVERKADM